MNNHELMEFLRARIDEDEQIAKATYFDHNFGYEWPDARNETRTPELIHTRRHDPARVLREIEAKRRLIDGVAPSADCYYGRCSCSGIDDAESHWLAKQAWLTFHTLAAVYSDHPDYRDDWRVA
jgi:hypothetical protein